MAKRKSQLTIQNTSKYYNLEVRDIEELNDFTLVNELNEREVSKELDEQEALSKRVRITNSKHYLILQNDGYNNDTLLEKLFKYAGRVTFYTDTIVPLYILDDMKNRNQDEVVFGYQDEYNMEQIDSIRTSFQAVQTNIRVPVILGKTNPYNFFFSFYPLQTNIDIVKFVIPNLTDKEVKDNKVRRYYTRKSKDVNTPKANKLFEFFKYFQDPLSTWKMYIYFYVEDERVRKYLETVAENKE